MLSLLILPLQNKLFYFLALHTVIKDMIFILNLNSTSLSIKESWLINMVSELGLVRGLVRARYLFAIYSPFVDLKVHEGLCLVCLTIHVWVWGCMWVL